MDLYAGVGLFSWTMTSRFKRVTAVESSAAAVADLMHNVPKAGAVRSSVDEYLSHTIRSARFRPGRPAPTGLGKHAVRHLLRMKPKRDHIVACDPATLARDMAQLLAAGYDMEQYDLS